MLAEDKINPFAALAEMLGVETDLRHAKALLKCRTRSLAARKLEVSRAIEDVSAAGRVKRKTLPFVLGHLQFMDVDSERRGHDNCELV